MKRIIFAALGSILFAAACSNSSNDNVKAADKINADKSDSGQNQQSVTDSTTAVASKQDADFTVSAFSGGTLEVVLGQLAQTHAQSQAVKDFGAMMVRDHGKGGEELKSLATAKRIIIPDSMSNAQNKERDDLQKKNGKDFDKAYIDLMISDHKEDIDDFGKASGNANDPDIKAFATNHLPMLHHHLESAQTIQQQIKKM